jgi:hypothetical protein
VTVIKIRPSVRRDNQGENALSHLDCRATLRISFLTIRESNILIYSANLREERGNVGIIRSPLRASLLPGQWDNFPSLLQFPYFDHKALTPSCFERSDEITADCPRKQPGI